MSKIPSPVPSREDETLHILNADLSPRARAAFGRWVAAVCDLVCHIDACPFGCTDDETRCSDGDAALDAQYARWQAWRKQRP